MAGPTGSAAAKKKPDGVSELMYQIRSFHAFLWLSGGGYSDFLIHNIDECCWMKDAWPVEAKASGGRHYRGDYIDQNFDVYSTEYTFEDGTKAMTGAGEVVSTPPTSKMTASKMVKREPVRSRGKTLPPAECYQGSGLRPFPPTS